MVRFYLEKVISQFTPVYGLYLMIQKYSFRNYDEIKQYKPVLNESAINHI